MGLHKSPALLVTLIIVISVVTPGFAELRFYLDASPRDDGVVTHNILGADFGPEEFNITAQLIFLEPGQDCDSLIPHSMYNGTIDYSALGDFVVYWDMVYGCPYQKIAFAAQQVGAKALIVHFREEIQFMPPMLRYTTDFEVTIPSIIFPDPDASDMFNYAVSQVLLGQDVTVEINAENVYVTKFFMVIGFIFGAMFSFEALAGWISLFIAFKFQRTRNEKLSFLLAAIQTTVQTFYNYTDFWQSKNYFPREVNIILWGLCIYLTFVEVYWFFWVWYTVLIRGTVYRNRRQYKRGRFVVICGTVAHGIAEVVRWTLLCIGPNYVYPMTVWRATLVPFIFIILSMFAGLVYVTCQLRSRLIASIKDMGSTGNRKTTHSLNKVTRIGFPIIAIILALSWSLIVFIVKPEVFGVVSITVYTLCFRTAFVYIPVAHLWSTADRWRREISSSQSSARSRNSRTSRVTPGNIFPKTTKSGEYDSGYARGSYGSNTDGDTGNDTGEEEDNNITNDIQVVRPVIETQASPDQDSNSTEVTIQN